MSDFSRSVAVTISVVPAISLGALRALQAAVTTAKAIVAIAACRLALRYLRLSLVFLPLSNGLNIEWLGLV